MTTAMEIKVIYCKLVTERGYKVDVRFSFKQSMPLFQKVAGICNDLELNAYAFLLAKFDRMPLQWCMKTFGSGYPPPYIVASPKEARQQYDDFLRKMDQYTKTTEFEVQVGAESQSEHVWSMLGKPTDMETLQLFIDNGTLSKEFVESLA